MGRSGSIGRKRYWSMCITKSANYIDVMVNSFD